MSKDDEELDAKLPTLGDWLSQLLGIRLPSLPHMPQTFKNIDKALATLVLSAGANLQSRIDVNSRKVKAAGKIDVEELYRNDEEKRKLENKAAVTKIALDDVQSDKTKEDAQAEIDTDWLNFFAKLAEDKSSAELQLLFGRILAGEIKRPGSFSLRTVQMMATMSKADAEAISTFLSFTIDGKGVAYRNTDDLPPDLSQRMLMEELGVAGHPSKIGGISLNFAVAPHDRAFFMMFGLGILVKNGTVQEIVFNIPCQPLTKAGQELMTIANPRLSSSDYLREISDNLYNQLNSQHPEATKSGELTIRGVAILSTDDLSINYREIYDPSSPF